MKSCIAFTVVSLAIVGLALVAFGAMRKQPSRANGTIERALVFDRALTQSEILELERRMFGDSRPRWPGLVTRLEALTRDGCSNVTVVVVTERGGEKAMWMWNQGEFVVRKEIK